MPKTVTLSHDYAADPRDVWHVATDFACFAQAMKGVASFDGMPSTGTLASDQTFDVKVRLFGWMPPMKYHMQVMAFDDERMSFLSHEHGGSIKIWRHHLTVAATQTGARLTDHIEIEAGLSTPLMGLWARFLYRRRHKPRLAMLAARRMG